MTAEEVTRCDAATKRFDRIGPRPRFVRSLKESPTIVSAGSSSRRDSPVAICGSEFERTRGLIGLNNSGWLFRYSGRLVPRIIDDR